MELLGTILFRADSSSTIGIGHIMRDLVLAARYKDAKIIFAVQNLEGNINAKISEAGYKLEILRSNDIKELDNLIKKLAIDLLVIDHYGIDYKFEKQLKEKNPQLTLMVLDDTYERHHCDILLNHNISANKKKYRGLVPKHCKLQCGDQYALIRDEFYKVKKQKRVFLAMGGADHSHINIKILKVLKKFKNIKKVDLVTTPANKHLKKLKKYSQNKKWIKLHINSDKIAKLMAKSDFAIVTPSVILNEVYFMQVPFIAIKTASNQKDMYNYIKKKKKTALKKFDKNKLKEKICKILS